MSGTLPAVRPRLHPGDGVQQPDLLLQIHRGIRRNGNVNVKVGAGKAAITVTAGGESRYTIPSITFSPRSTHFTWPAGENAHVAVIVDTAATVESVKYTTVVTDTVANCTIDCDPVIHNVP